VGVGVSIKVGVRVVVGVSELVEVAVRVMVGVRRVAETVTVNDGVGVVEFHAKSTSTNPRQ